MAAESSRHEVARTAKLTSAGVLMVEGAVVQVLFYHAVPGIDNSA
jgi:hypothetical protein